MGAAVDLLEQVREDDEVHEHLCRDCPWYRNISEEKNCAHDPAEHCPHGGKGGPLAKFTAAGEVWLTPRTAEASTVVKPTVPPGGPGLFHQKGMHLPPYMEHLWFHLVKRYGKHGAYRVANGIVHKWAKGINPGGWKTKSGKGKRVHPEVQAAAQKNIAEWEKDRAQAHAHTASEHVKASVSTAPGLREVPVSTGGPRKPMPPKVPMPTAEEVRDLVGQVPECSDASLSMSARKHLETAAVKLERDAPLDALALLRATQSDILAAHKADVGPDVAAVFVKAPPAEQSSATSEDRQAGMGRTLAWRAVEQKVAGLADRIRRNFFHGIYSGPGQPVRLGTEDGMSASERLIALANRVVTGQDVSEPVTSDASGRTPELNIGDVSLEIGGGKAGQEMAGLPAVDKVRVSAYLARAREMRRTNPGGAAQLLMHAAYVAGEGGARHLHRHLHQMAQAVVQTRADTTTRRTGASTPGHTDSKDAPSGGTMRLTARLR
jgi:hypothetical protein